MEIIFLVAAAAIVWLYLFNTTLCYILVGGGYVAILMFLITARILKARRLVSVKNLETEARVGPFHRPEKLADIPGRGMMAGGG